MKQKLLTLVLLLTALCVALCGCTAQDVTLPAQVDMVPGTTLTLADLAEYTGPDLSGEGMIQADEVAEMVEMLVRMRGNAVVDEIRLHRAGKEPFQ